MSKSKWESKVGELLVEPRFPWRHKCPDGMHAGAVKIDWIAIDSMGMGWMIEVKYSSTKTLTPVKLFGDKGVTPLQRQALTDFSRAGNAWLAIGHKGTNSLYLWEWPWINNLAEKMGQDTLLYLASAARIISFPRGKSPMEYLRWSQMSPIYQKFSLSGSPLSLAWLTESEFTTSTTMTPAEISDAVLHAQAAFP